jgi:anti-sigma factor (TIGR02949 family)
MNEREHVHGGRSCREMLERLSEYLDGELPDDLCERIEGHMKDCTPCSGFLESLRRTIGLIRESGPGDLPEDLRRELLAAAARLEESL